MDGNGRQVALEVAVHRLSPEVRLKRDDLSAGRGVPHGPRLDQRFHCLAGVDVDDKDSHLAVPPRAVTVRVKARAARAASWRAPAEQLTARSRGLGGLAAKNGAADD